MIDSISSYVNSKLKELQTKLKEFDSNSTSRELIKKASQYYNDDEFLNYTAAKIKAQCEIAKKQMEDAIKRWASGHKD